MSDLRKRAESAIADWSIRNESANDLAALLAEALDMLPKDPEPKAPEPIKKKRFIHAHLADDGVTVFIDEQPGSITCPDHATALRVLEAIAEYRDDFAEMFLKQIEIACLAFGVARPDVACQLQQRIPYNELSRWFNAAWDAAKEEGK